MGAKKVRVGIIGGGITGLTTAYRLAKKGVQIVLFEKKEDLGGLAGSFKIGQASLERYYHHFYVPEKEIIGLIKELDLEADIIWVKTKTGIFCSNEIFPFTTPKDILSLKLLSPAERIRLISLALYFLRHNNYREFEGLTAMEWAISRCGEKAAKIIWQALLRSKFGEKYSEVVAVYLWERIKTRSRSRSQNLIRERIGYLRGGFGRLIGALKRKILDLGGTVLTNSCAEKIIIDHGKVNAILCNNKLYQMDKVAVTTANPQFLAMLPGEQGGYFVNLKQIQYQHTVCLVLRLNRSLSDIYWLSICDPQIPFAAVIEHTNLISLDNYSDSYIVYLPKYISSEDSYYSYSAQDIFREFVPFLSSIFPQFRSNWVIDYHLFRDQFTQAIFPLYYSKMKPINSTPIKNLFLANTTQVYPSSRSLNSCIRMANRISNII